MLNNPEAAGNITNGILSSCQRLRDFPGMGVSLKEKIELDTNYRCLFFRNYIVFYTFDSSTVIVNRILDGRTEYLKIIFP